MATGEDTHPPIDWQHSGGAVDGEQLRWIVETDRRRGAVGLLTTTNVTIANRMAAELWLEPDQAAAVARAILAAVEGMRADRAAHVQIGPGGLSNG